MTNPQTEARAIAERLRAHRQAFGVHYEQRPVEVCIEGAEAIDRLATALVAKDAELAAAHKLACANAQDAADESERAARAEAAERALAERAGGVKVKPLEWNHGYASVMFGGGYLVTYYAGMEEPAKLETRGWWDGEPNGYFKTVDEAKAAAQADYERRILSALEPAAPEGRYCTCANSLTDNPCIVCAQNRNCRMGFSYGRARG